MTEVFCDPQTCSKEHDPSSGEDFMSLIDTRLLINRNKYKVQTVERSFLDNQRSLKQLIRLLSIILIPKTH